MCTTIGFPYKDGIIFGRTLEMGITLDNQILYVPKNYNGFIQTNEKEYATKYAVIGTGFMNIPSFGDGMNEMGLMGSSNLFPGYSSFATEEVAGKINVPPTHAFDYLLSRCKDVQEVKTAADQMVLMEQENSEQDASPSMHFFFKDAHGNAVVLEPKDGQLLQYDNPYGVLTNAPAFPWHVTNLKNYIHLQPENIEKADFNGVPVSKLGEGSGMVGLPGDFTPPARFVRAAYFVSQTPKDLERHAAILQGFRILSQADIPTGAIVDPQNGHNDETLYTSIMDTQKKAYFIKHHNNINIQSFYLDDYKDVKELTFIDIQKEMNL